MKKVSSAAAICLMVLLAASGCYKVATVKVDDGPAVTKPVSFKKDMLPVFTKSCALAGCHGVGSKDPDLSAAAAYNSLIKGNYTNKTSPATSRLYLWLTGKMAIPMPMGTTNNPANINALTLAWITQGVLNN